MRFFLFFILGLIPISFYAQADRAVKLETKIYDTAHTAIYYDLQFLRDSTKVGVYKRGKTVLRVSDRYLSFADCNNLLSDSLNDYASLSRKNEKEVAEQSSKLKTMYNTPLLTNLQKGETTFQLGMWTQLEYTIPTPQIDWNLMAGDTLVNGVTCKKAMGRYAGRTYVAWYAESVQLPYGPYIFGGLPGLIMCIYDTKRNWIFTNSGIKPATSLAKMYLYTEKEREKMDRKKALSIYRNELENMISVGIAKGRLLNVPPELVQKTSSNMLELEW